MDKEQRRLKFLGEHPNFSFEYKQDFTSEKYRIKRRIYRKANKDKINARWKLHYYIKKGQIKREDCEICGNTKSQGHHQDYKKPLEVNWLCQQHHSNIHKGILTLDKKM